MPILCGHHVLRYVGGRRISQGGKVDPAGFDDEDDVSVNWMECKDGTEKEQIQRIRNLIRLSPGATAKLVKLNVGEIRLIHNGLNVVSDPLDSNEECSEVPCHAEIVGIPKESDDPDLRGRILEALAAQVGVDDLYKAK